MNLLNFENIKSHIKIYIVFEHTEETQMLQLIFQAVKIGEAVLKGLFSALVDDSRALLIDFKMSCHGESMSVFESYCMFLSSNELVHNVFCCK